MPIHRKVDKNGTYFQWGERGAKYYYKTGDKVSREAARKKAERQARAAYSHGYTGR